MKKGISLIVLVITIIVMIILAATVIISLSNSGIMKRANYAVKITNEKQAQQIASMVWSEMYLDNYRGDVLVTKVKEELDKQGVKEEDWNIEITDKGVEVTEKTIEQLARPTTTITNNTLTVTDVSGKATEYVVYVNGVEKETTTNSTIALDTLGLTTGEYKITVLAKADGYTASEVSEEVTYTVIEFTIAGTTYYTRSGSDWTEWVNSTYNTASATISSDKVYIGSKYVTTDGSTPVSSTSTINSGVSYKMYTESYGGDHAGGSV